MRTWRDNPKKNPEARRKRPSWKWHDKFVRPVNAYRSRSIYSPHHGVQEADRRLKYINKFEWCFT